MKRNTLILSGFLACGLIIAGRFINRGKPLHVSEIKGGTKLVIEQKQWLNFGNSTVVRVNDREWRWLTNAFSGYLNTGRISFTYTGSVKLSPEGTRAYR